MLCAYCTGESSVEVKTEADSNDITEHPYDDKLRPYLCTVCHKRFKVKEGFELSQTNTQWRKLTFVYTV